jgi:hypothetical protein
MPRSRTFFYPCILEICSQNYLIVSNKIPSPKCNLLGIWKSVFSQDNKTPQNLSEENYKYAHKNTNRRHFSFSSQWFVLGFNSETLELTNLFVFRSFDNPRIPTSTISAIFRASIQIRWTGLPFTTGIDSRIVLFIRISHWIKRSRRTSSKMGKFSHGLCLQILNCTRE